MSQIGWRNLHMNSHTKWYVPSTSSLSFINIIIISKVSISSLVKLIDVYRRSSWKINWIISVKSYFSISKTDLLRGKGLAASLLRKTLCNVKYRNISGDFWHSRPRREEKLLTEWIQAFVSKLWRLLQNNNDHKSVVWYHTTVAH